MLGIGDRIPPATVWLAPRERVELPQLLVDRRPLLLLFFLFDFSATWTDELSLLRDRGTEFEEAGVALYGISRDSPYTHIAWSQVLDLTFPLLSDWNGEATERFGLAFEYRGLKGVSRRSAFLVATDGTVCGAWSYDTGDVPDVDELLSAARGLRS